MNYIAFQSTHPVRGGTLYPQRSRELQKGFQSTHPVRGGTQLTVGGWTVLGISIHPPREGWDRSTLIINSDLCQFQSTHPVRGGTRPRHSVCHGESKKFQSTHPVRGGTPETYTGDDIDIISIHPPREGWDMRTSGSNGSIAISIHPPREGWDPADQAAAHNHLHFNPPTP